VPIAPLCRDDCPGLEVPAAGAVGESGEGGEGEGNEEAGSAQVAEAVGWKAALQRLKGSLSDT